MVRKAKGQQQPDEDQSVEEQAAPRLIPRVIAPRRGWKGAGNGRVGHVERGSIYLGTTTQVAGLFPFIQPSGLPAEGIPIGPDLLTAELTCLDPQGWVGRLTKNPGIWIQGEPGAGKSAVTKRLCTGLSAYGHMIVVPGDVKAEYTELVSDLGGQVIKIGRGKDRINPLDAGPLGRRLAEVGESEREALLSEIGGRRADLIQALLTTTHGLGRRPSAEEAAAVNEAVRAVSMVTTGPEPTIPDVIRVLREPTEAQLDRLLMPNLGVYIEQIRSVIAALENLCSGPLSGLFDQPTTTPLDLNSPAVAVDLSSILTAGDQVVATALLATWAYTYSAIDTARAFGMLERPVVLPLDELWRALRAGAGLVSAFDAITRLNRSRGEISIMITHSLRDLDALPTEEDRAKASGLMERCDTLILVAQSMAELERVSAAKPLTGPEKELVASWASPTATGIDGTAQVHPGRGKLLIKIGQRLGIPVQLALTPVELRLYDTDAAIRRSVGGQFR
jgi:hypothetical protein